MATRDDGKTVFVEDGVPGDVVRARIVEERPRFARARIVEVLEPSPDRVAPRCAVFGRCGGCRWQHVRYRAQVDAKAAILRDALERIGGFTLAGEPAMTASPLEYGYRVRARVRAGRGRVGFLERGSHRVVPVDACPVLDRRLEQAILDRGVVPASGKRDVEWSVCVGHDGAISASRTPRVAGPLEEARGEVELDVGGRRLGLDARAFAQANASLHERLVARVRAVLFEGVSQAERRAWTLLEVHAGIGFFTSALAGDVARVVAVESGEVACDWLARNVEAVGAAPVEIVRGTFEDAAPKLAGRRFDAVLLDPPRTGLAPAELEALCELGPSRIAYLSCDPATLARDARGLAEHGWVLAHVEGLDLFPQTPHVEALVRLVRDRPGAGAPGATAR